MSAPPIDPISAATVGATVVFGPLLAQYIGPYAVIFFASFLGGVIALRRDEQMRGWWYPPAFLLAVMGIAGLVTVPLSQWLATLAPGTLGSGASTWLLIPVALAVGVIGFDWLPLLLWFWDKRLALFELMGKPKGEKVE